MIKGLHGSNVHNYWSHQIGPSSGNLKKEGKLHSYARFGSAGAMPKILADASQIVMHTLLIFSPSL